MQEGVVGVAEGVAEGVVEGVVEGEHAKKLDGLLEGAKKLDGVVVEEVDILEVEGLAEDLRAVEVGEGVAPLLEGVVEAA